MFNNYFKKTLTILGSAVITISSILPYTVNAEEITLNDPYSYAQYYLQDTGVANILQNKNTHISSDPVKVAVYDGGFQVDDDEINWAKDRLQVASETSDNTKYSCVSNSSYGHGTGVSSVIGMEVNNSIGGTGVTPKVAIYPIDVEMTNIGSYYRKSDNLPTCGQCGRNHNSLNDAIEYCMEKQIQILNISMFPMSPNIDHVKKYVNNGGIIVCAAGNSPSDLDTMNLSEFYNLDGVITVTGSRNGKAAKWASYGKNTVEIAAPCMDILMPKSGNEYYANSGTSEASPFVAGVCALLKSYFPTATMSQIKDAIMDSVDKDSTLEDRCSSGGTINAERAMISLEKILGYTITDGEYYIKQSSSNRYLTYDAAGIYNNVRLDIKNQAKKWKVEITKDGTYAIFPADNTSASLDIVNAYMADSNQVWQYKYNEDKCQNWHFVKKTANAYQLQSAVNKDYSLSSSYSNGVDGAVIKKTLNNTASQQWIFEKVEEKDFSGTFYIKNNKTHSYLTRQGNAYEVKYNNTCETSASKWKIEKVGSYYKIVSSENNNMCLEVYYANKVNKELVWQLGYGGYDCQLWNITKNDDGSYKITSKLSDEFALSYNDAPVKNVYNIPNSLCISNTISGHASSWTLENVDDKLDGKKFTNGNSKINSGTIKYLGNDNYMIINQSTGKALALTIVDGSSDINCSVTYNSAKSYDDMIWNYDSSRNSDDTNQVWKIREINNYYYLIPYKYQCTTITNGTQNTWLTSEVNGLLIN